MQQMNSRGASVYLHRSGENWIFGYGIYGAGAVARQQIYPPDRGDDGEFRAGSNEWGGKAYRVHAPDPPA